MAIYSIFPYQPSNGLLTGYGFFFVLYSSFLLIMMWSDMEQQIIMNPQLALFAILGLCYHLLLQPDQLFLQLLTAIASGLIFLLLPLLTRGGIGWGDIKILAALGLWPGDIFSLN
ncbi:MAG: prepilin peptidase [Anaerovibrio sp.]